MNKKNIFVEPNEEIISIIDQIIDSPENKFNLVIPQGAQVWQSLINLKLLKREAELMGKDITLIVSDDLGKEIAEGVGFGVVKDKDFSIKFSEEEEQEEETLLVPPPDDELEGETKKQQGKATEESPLRQPADSEKDEGLPAVEEQEQFESITAASLEGKLDENKDNMIDILAKEMKNNKKKNRLIVSKIDKDASLKKMADIINPKKNIKVDLFRSAAKRRFFPKRKKDAKEPKIKRRIKPENYPDSIKEKMAYYSGKPSLLSKFFAIFITAAIIIAGIIGYLILPSAELTIFPKTEAESLDLSLTGSKDAVAINAQTNEIPLKEISVRKTKSQEFLATGEKQLDEKARGVITVYNEYSSEPQTLVATTRFESSDGKIFRISKNVIIPGASINEGKIIASWLDVEVTADQPGEEYNIGPSNFTIPGFKGGPKFAAFYGSSKEAMTDGSTKKVKVVLKTDLEQAQKILTDGLRDEVNSSLKDQIPEDYKMFEGGTKEDLTNVFPTAKENDQVDKFTLEIEIVVRSLLYKEDDLKNLINSKFVAAMPEGKNPLSETQKIEWSEPIEIDWQKGEAKFKIKAEEDLAFEIDIEKIKSDLAGKKEVEVRKYLSSQLEIERATISFWPFWVKKIPSQLKKIKVIIK